MPYACLANLASSDVQETEIGPEIFRARTRGALPEKETWGYPATESAFISGFIGLIPSVRVSAQNPAREMRAFIADYDSSAPETEPELLAYLSRKLPANAPWMPTYVHKTYSGNMRFIWEFSEPLLLSEPEHTEAFIRNLRKKHLLLNKWAPALDEGCLNPRQYYQTGYSWTRAGGAISREIVSKWYSDTVIECAKSRHTRVSDIPLQQVAVELERIFPGCLPSGLDIGTRTRRFWDNSADNSTAAVAVESGFVCWTGPQGHVPWSQLIPREVLERYSAQKFDDDLNKYSYDGKNFWIRHELLGTWRTISKEDFTQSLRVKGYDATKKKHETFSEIDKAETRIKQLNRVDMALPLLHRKSGINELDGQRVLNTINSNPVKPCEHVVTEDMIERECPIIWTLINKMFGARMKNGETQLAYFLAWLKHAYVGALEQNPSQGLALIIAGAPGCGKTLLSWQVISPLLGGRCDGAAYLVQGSEWTGNLIQSPVMTIDDSEALMDNRTMARFANRLKRTIANPEILYNQKYRDQQPVQWLGRIVITCNLDAISTQIIPSMDNSMHEKVMLLGALCTDATVRELLPGNVRDNNQAVQNELPAFASFLLSMNCERYTIEGANPRFGVTYFHNNWMRSASRIGMQETIVEYVRMLVENMRAQNPTAVYNGWKLSTVQAHQALSGILEKSFDMTVTQLGTYFGVMQNQGYHIEKHRVSTGGAWVFFEDSARKGRRPPSNNLEELRAATLEDDNETALTERENERDAAITAALIPEPEPELISAQIQTEAPVKKTRPRKKKEAASSE
jgi:hypothetical protein